MSEIVALSARLTEEAAAALEALVDERQQTKTTVVNDLILAAGTTGSEQSPEDAIYEQVGILRERRQELDAWEAELTAREASFANERLRVEELEQELAKREEELTKREEEVKVMWENPPASVDGESEDLTDWKAEIEEALRNHNKTYSDRMRALEQKLDDSPMMKDELPNAIGSQVTDLFDKNRDLFEKIAIIIRAQMEVRHRVETLEKRENL